MDLHLKNIKAAAALNATRQAPATSNYSGVEHTELVTPLCLAMAARVPPAEAASAAGLILPELFNTLRGHP